MAPEEQEESERIYNKLVNSELDAALHQFLWLPVKFGDERAIAIMSAAISDWVDWVLSKHLKGI